MFCPFVINSNRQCEINRSFIHSFVIIFIAYSGCYHFRHVMLISKPNHSMLKNSGSSAIADSDATILDSNGVAIIDSTVDQSIANNSQTSPPPISTNNGQQLPLKVGPLASTNETRIVYHVDDEETPYLVKLPIPHSQIKLSDFKSAISLPRPHYKYFFKSYDKEVGVVKEEIFDDNASLPIFKDRVVAWV